MKIFEKSFRFSASLIIIIVLSLSTIIIGWVYFASNDGRLSAVLGSLVAGLIVAIIQFIIAWQDYQETEKLKKLKLIEILYNRNEKSWYGKYISEATNQIDVMGVTALRLFNDFANTDIHAPKIDKVLINALEKGITVRVLLPAEDFLPTEDKKQDAAKVRKKYQALEKKYSNLKLRYFQHSPAHSIFRVDDDCIVGPVFPEVESKYTPGLRLKNSSPLATNYITYFDDEWKKADQITE
jgi:type III secretory pathway component EscS